MQSDSSIISIFSDNEKNFEHKKQQNAKENKKHFTNSTKNSIICIVDIIKYLINYQSNVILKDKIFVGLHY